MSPGMSLLRRQQGWGRKEMLSSLGKGSAGLWQLPTPNQAPTGSAQLRKADSEPGASDKLDLEGSENNALTTFVFA